MIRFHFEDSAGDIVRANTHWRLVQSNKTVASGYLTLPVEPAVFAGKTNGEASASLTLNRYGAYWYDIQVEDAAGNKSNVLQGAILIDAPVPWAKKPLICDMPMGGWKFVSLSVGRENRSIAQS